MGFFSTLANSITGGWANVAVGFAPATRGEPLEVTIVVAVKSSDILVNEVYLNVECREVVTVPNYQLRDPQNPEQVRSITIHETTSLHRVKQIVAPGGNFSAHSQHTFTASVNLPPNLPPSYNGRNTRLEWVGLAGLDMKGNDPDSGWQPIMVS